MLASEFCGRMCRDEVAVKGADPRLMPSIVIQSAAKDLEARLIRQIPSLRMTFDYNRESASAASFTWLAAMLACAADSKSS